MAETTGSKRASDPGFLFGFVVGFFFTVDAILLISIVVMVRNHRG